MTIGDMIVNYVGCFCWGIVAAHLWEEYHAHK